MAQNTILFEKYLPQMAVSEIGTAGQNRLSEAKILIVGAGGLGTPLATYLVAMGVGTIGIADGDLVSATNLHRQFQYTAQDIGLNKAKILCARLQTLNPDCKMITYPFFVNEDEQILQEDYTLICDCTDNAQARIFINYFCQKYHKKLVYGAAKDWQGYVTVLHHTKKITLSDIFEEAMMLQENENNCVITGIVSPVCGVIANLQALEAIKIILKLPSVLDGGILCFHALKNIFKIFHLKKINA